MINSGKAVVISEKIRQKSLIEEEKLLKCLQGNDTFSSASFPLHGEIKSNIFEILSSARNEILSSSLESKLDQFFADSELTDYDVRNYSGQSKSYRVKSVKELKNKILLYIEKEVPVGSFVSDTAIKFIEKHRDELLQNRFSPQYVVEEIDKMRIEDGLNPLMLSYDEIPDKKQLSDLDIDKNLPANLKSFDTAEIFNQINYNIFRKLGYEVKVKNSSEKSLLIDKNNITLSYSSLTVKDGVSTGYILMAVNALFKIAEQLNASSLGKILAENGNSLQAKTCYFLYNKLSFSDKSTADSAFERATNLISTINLARICMKPDCFVEVEKSLTYKVAQCMEVLQSKMDDSYVTLALANNVEVQSKKIYKQFKLSQSFLTEKYAGTYVGFAHNSRIKNVKDLIYPNKNVKKTKPSRLTELSDKETYYSFDYRDMLTKPIYSAMLERRNSEFNTFVNGVKEEESVEKSSASAQIKNNINFATGRCNRVLDSIRNVKKLKLDQLSEIVSLYTTAEVLLNKCKWLISENLSEKKRALKPQIKVESHIPAPSSFVPVKSDFSFKTNLPSNPTPPLSINVEQEKAPSSISEKDVRKGLNSSFRKIINRISKTAVSSLATENLQELSLLLTTDTQEEDKVADTSLITSLQTLFTLPADKKTTLKGLANAYKTNPTELTAVALLKVSYQEGFVNELSKILSDKAVEIKMKNSTLSDQEILNKTLEKLHNKFTKELEQKHDVEIDMLNFQFPGDRDSEEYKEEVNRINVKYYGDILEKGEISEVNENILQNIVRDTLLSQLKEIKSGLKNYKNSLEKMKQCANQLFYDPQKTENAEWIDEN